MKIRATSTALVTLAIFSFTSWAAIAAPDPALVDLRREVADMRREISDLRREIYALRLDLLAAIGQLSGGSVTPPAEGTTSKPPALPPEVAPTKARPGPEPGTGRVTGVVRLGSDTGVAYVFVDNVPLRMARNKSITIKQVQRQFAPRWAVIQVGTKITFPNEDSVYHNVFSLSPGNTFDLGIYRSGEPAKSYTVTTPGVLDIFCNMHSEMTSSVLVVPSPLYIEAGRDGRFTLDQVPTGSRKIVAWSPGHEASAQTVTVKPGQDSSLIFTLKTKSSQHTNKNGQPYGSYR